MVRRANFVSSICCTYRNPTKIHGKTNARIVVVNECRTKAIRRFFRVKVKIWRVNKAISSRDSRFKHLAQRARSRAVFP